MKKIEVEGMHRLNGEVRVQGSKNAVLPVLSACVLNHGETVIHGCPKIQDVTSMLDVLRYAGAKAVWEGHMLIIDTSSMSPVPLIEKAGTMRSSLMLLGSFLARFGRAVLGYPGGCRIGKRPIDLHEQALSSLGVIFCEEEEHFEARCARLTGCDIYLPYPSVGVTENVLLAAVGAQGETHIFGAAMEPEIVELCRFLTLMGVSVSGAGTGSISVTGGANLHGAEFTLCPDRIVAGTYLLAGVGAGGEIVVKNTPYEQMESTIRTAEALGAELTWSGKEVKLVMNDRPRGISFLNTAPYPGFPTDLQSPLLAVLCRADQRSVIEERVFENRFLIAGELCRMGASVHVEGRKAYTEPAKSLRGAKMTAKDLRGGAALVLAALTAEGISTVDGAEIIERGYEDIAGDLAALGACCKLLQQ